MAPFDYNRLINEEIQKRNDRSIERLDIERRRLDDELEMINSMIADLIEDMNNIPNELINEKNRINLHRVAIERCIENAMNNNVL